MKRKIMMLKDPEGKVLATFDPTPNPIAHVRPAEEDLKELKLKIEESEVEENYEFELPQFYKKYEVKRK